MFFGSLTLVDKIVINVFDESPPLSLNSFSRQEIETNTTTIAANEIITRLSMMQFSLTNHTVCHSALVKSVGTKHLMIC